MAYLMVTQGSGRRNGHTATLMKNVVESLQEVEGLEVEVYHLHDYTIKPCTSCFSCIRNVGSGCILDDDWGRKGEGSLYLSFKRANGLLMVDPVHGWGMSAMSHLFLERIYPTFWEGIPYGMPFASIACASNQGYQGSAIQEYSKKAAGSGFRWIGGLPVHLANLNDARPRAIELGLRLADAALDDERNGRTKLTDKEIFSMYMGTPWDIVDGYIENITGGTFSYADSIPARALADGVFTNPDARELIEKVCEHLKTALEYYNTGNRMAASPEMALVAKFWTNGTYLQFGKDIVKASIPKAYRPLDEIKEK